MNDHSIIIYQSEFTKRADRFYSENPEYILYILGAGVVIILGFIIWDKISRKMRLKKFLNSRW